MVPSAFLMTLTEQLNSYSPQLHILVVLFQRALQRRALPKTHGNNNERRSLNPPPPVSQPCTLGTTLLTQTMATSLIVMHSNISCSRKGFIGLCVMLEKVMGLKVINKLQTIFFTENNFNAAYKVIYGEGLLNNIRKTS